VDHFLSALGGWGLAAAQALGYLLLGPLLAGWIAKVRARLQNRRGAPLTQPLRDLRKLLAKEVRIAHTASPLLRAAPYVVFAATLLAAASVPLLGVALPTAALADILVIAGLLALARFFLALAAMDAGTAFGGMGASREMLIAALAEPAVLLAVFTLAMIAHSTSLADIVAHQLHSDLVLRPSFLFALGALCLVAIAETGRIPIDNPTTHLELTMIHEAMLLEYSGRHLALMEWAAHVKLALYAALILNIFLPWGIAARLAPLDLALAAASLAVKLLALGTALAVAETVLAKMRLFRAPSFLNLALLFGLLGLLSHVMLEVGR
jgi:formate hydrogenlyase subunit 4